MKIQFSIVGQTEHPTDIVIDESVVPREGEEVYVRGLDRSLSVRRVVYYPEGSDEDSDPFVYVVIGPPRAR